MSLSTTFTEAADLIRRNVYALLVIGAIVFVPADLVTALIDHTRGWGDVRLARFVLRARAAASVDSRTARRSPRSRSSPRAPKSGHERR